MPRYKVDAPGFFDGELYKPDGKRNILTVDKPFTKDNPMPSWVSKMPTESAAAKKKREARETKAAEDDAAKNKSDNKDIADASFLGAGESGSGSQVETI